ncbi:uncharacterized protein LOC131229811 [Magnolia sinica]|uniref:uncharacterized protein LOC131229811 n=1 Tax=Magnolia sinica TaxID=86752 RepID=UPI00265A4962|nr:uncharacterized protein LOC131229811 [Magnolia sinica]
MRATPKLVSSDSRGRMRGLGCSISKTGLKKSTPVHSKLDNMIKEKEGLKKEILEIKKSLVDIKARVGMHQESQSGQNLSSPPVAKSTQASSSDIIYISKRCELLGWGLRGVVARGQVHEVSPNVVVHGEPVAEGAFVVILTEIIHPGAPLWKEDGFASTLGEAGTGSFVQWGKQSMRFQ